MFKLLFSKITTSILFLSITGIIVLSSCSKPDCEHPIADCYICDVAAEYTNAYGVNDTVFLTGPFEVTVDNIKGGVFATLYKPTYHNGQEFDVSNCKGKLRDNEPSGSGDYSTINIDFFPDSLVYTISTTYEWSQTYRTIYYCNKK